MNREIDKMDKTDENAIKPKKSEKESELLKKIAYHEVYSTAYKLNLAKILLVKGAKAASKAAIKGGKFIKTKYEAAQDKKTDKRF